MSEAKTRIYLVTNGAFVHLVRATTNAQALRHVAKTTMSVRLASQDDILKYARNVDVEDVTEVDGDE